MQTFTLPAAALAPRADATRPHFAFLAAVPPAGAPPQPQDDSWLDACHQLTTRVERVAGGSALLELGTCSESEACAAIGALMRALARAGLAGRVGLAPSLTLAQLAALLTAPEQRLTLVTPASAPTFLRDVPTAVLVQLHPQGVVTSEVVERLHQFGLRTLGHVARLGEPALRRQFGNMVGAFLAAVAAGRDPRPLQPTPPPARLHARLRLLTPAGPEEVLAALPAFCRRIAARLRHQGRHACRLRVALRWERGDVASAQSTLRQSIRDPDPLARELRRLVLPLLEARARRAADAAAVSSGGVGEAVDELLLTLTDFAPVIPMQATFWRSSGGREQRLTAVREVAGTLTRRHNRPLLLSSHLVCPAAIFSEERYELLPTGTEGGAARSGKPQQHHAHVLDPSRDPWQQMPQHLHWW